MKKIIILIVLGLLLFGIAKNANAAFPMDKRYKYANIKQELGIKNSTPGWVMNSFNPQGIFLNQPLYLRLR